MSRRSIRKVAVALMALWVCLVAEPAAACPVCFGEPGSEASNNITMAMLTLLGVTLVVFAGIGGVVLSIYIHNKRAADDRSEPALRAGAGWEGHV